MNEQEWVIVIPKLHDAILAYLSLLLLDLLLATISFTHYSNVLEIVYMWGYVQGHADCNPLLTLSCVDHYTVDCLLYADHHTVDCLLYADHHTVDCLLYADHHTVDCLLYADHHTVDCLLYALYQTLG